MGLLRAPGRLRCHSAFGAFRLDLLNQEESILSSCSDTGVNTLRKYFPIAAKSFGYMVTLFELGAHDELVKLGENRDMVSAGKGHLAAPGTRPDRSAFVLAPKWFQEAGQLV